MMNINLLLVGAQKSATTSLHNYLSIHPDIFLSNPVKEPGYFLPKRIVKPLMKKKGIIFESKDELLTKYMAKGYDDQIVCGESSTYYTLGELARKHSIPQRIYYYNRDMRFIYVTRDPFERIMSNYRHGLKKKHINGTLGHFLQNNERPILTSCYAYQMEPYLDLFPIENFLFLKYEEVINYPLEAINQVYEFLKLKTLSKEDVPAETFKQYNATVHKEMAKDDAALMFQKDMPEIYDRIGADLIKFEQLTGLKQHLVHID